MYIDLWLKNTHVPKYIDDPLPRASVDNCQRWHRVGPCTMEGPGTGVYPGTTGTPLIRDYYLCLVVVVNSGDYMWSSTASMTYQLYK